MTFPVVYKNGNYTVMLLNDGTKFRFFDDNPKPDFPESLDVKITDYCDLNCAFCHENSTKEGKHANLEKLFNFLKDLPPGVELAIGGGNPLEHPDLPNFLKACSEHGFIANVTVNYSHLYGHYLDLLTDLIKSNLVYGIGVSVNHRVPVEPIKKLMEISNNVVLHVIAGIINVDTFQYLMDKLDPKILILGYKYFGRGKKYFSPSVNKNLESLKTALPSFIGKIPIAFDNLALEQLSVKGIVDPDVWDKYYMGDDGSFTMYIDAVKMQYAVSSSNSERFDIVEDVKNCFKNVSKKE